MSTHMPEILRSAAISTLPATALYIADFITIEEENVLLSQISNRPVRDWKVLSKRRLQAWPSVIRENKLIAEPLPGWLANPILPRLKTVVQSQHIFAQSPHGEPNHCLINVYEPGTGIMPHFDGPAYHPLVATVSLGAPIVFDIHERAVGGGIVRFPKYRILQEPRSLLVILDELYTSYLHGIADVDEDRDLAPETIANWSHLGHPTEYQNGSFKRRTRTSLTFRDVPLVIKSSKLFPGLAPRAR